MMKAFAVASLLGAISLVQSSPTPTEQQPPSKRATIPTVTVSGNAFWTGSERFYVRGLDYQPGGSSANADPLADPKVCKRDLEKFKALGINTIRVYSVDNSKNHDECMNAFADAGIYLVVDVNNPMYSINRAKPAPSYNAEYLQSVFATMDEFVKYPNTMAFFSGNEVVHDAVNTTLAARYVKAVTRDMRGYMVKRGVRRVPVGYSAADVSQNRMQLAHYMNCGSDDERSDFFAFNDYSWCSSDFKTSGWDVKVRNFTGYGVPIFLSEYGCNTNVRDFGEVKALMSSDMTGVYSGGLMYEYTYEENKYGIVKIDKSGNVEELKPEFANFAKAMKDNPAPSGDGGASSTSTASQCPPADENWLISTTALPALPKDAERYFTNGAGTGPGLNGKGSQQSGPDEIPDAQTGSGFATGGNGSSDSSKGNAAPSDAAAPMLLAGSVAILSVLSSMVL